jgi:3-dehydroquinate dehydratase type I
LSTIKICVSLPLKTVGEAFCLIESAEAQNADFIELRLDYLKKQESLVNIPACFNTPLIATNKSVEQHGCFSGNESERQKILVDAARNGFDYVDVDLGTPRQTEFIQNLHDGGAKVIASFHDFEQTPQKPQLNSVLKEEVSLGADVCKIITTARSMKDNLITLNFVSEASKKVKLVCFAMGDFGKHSRLVSPVFGAFFTFACLDEKRKTAKGQLTIQEMNCAYEALGLK